MSKTKKSKRRRGLPMPPGATIQIIGMPRPGAEPVERKATLEDCVDDCDLCQQLRKEILAGRAPTILAFD